MRSPGPAALAALCAMLTAGPAAAADLVVGSKNFTENRILAEMMAQLIEAHTDLEVERRTNLGGTMVVFAALQSGDIDLYPEYTGTGWAIVLKRQGTRDALETYVTVAREYQARYGLIWLSPFGFENSYAIAVRDDVADRLSLRRISDLTPHLSTLRLGLSHEFLRREDGWPGLARAYQFPAAATPTGMEHGLAYEAIDSGRIDIVDTWTTDGKLARFDVTVLEDDHQFFPPYDCAPVIRQGTLAAHPEVGPLLARLAFKIDNRRMQRINALVEAEGLSFAAAAHRFLDEAGLLQAGAAAKSAPTPAAAPTPTGTPLAQLLLTHVWLTFLALLLAALGGIPLGLWLTRHPRFAGPVIGATGVIQTVPSLALLAFMIPIPGLGLGSRSAVLALFLYALLPIVRNTYTGVTEVDADIVDAARGMGLTDRQRLVLVELPLASRTIMAGIRTSAVIGIGIATLAAFIGAGGLGDPIITGLQLNDTAMVLRGAVPAALLAVVADVALGLVERRLAPPGT